MASMKIVHVSQSVSKRFEGANDVIKYQPKFKKISIVIPALNEEEVIGKTLALVPKETLEKMGLKSEVIVVDNNSADRTGEIARKWGAKVVFEPKKGYGNAYKRGFSIARGDIIVMSDADATYPLEKTPELIQPILRDVADVVIGSRFRGIIQNGAMSFIHKVGNRFLTFLLNINFGLDCSDAHSGFRAFRGDILRSMQLTASGMEFANELIIETAKKKLRLVEIPIEYRARDGGNPKLQTIRDGWKHVKFIIKRKLSDASSQFPKSQLRLMKKKIQKYYSLRFMSNKSESQDDFD